MDTLFLGVIAGSVLVMAALQMAAIVFAVRATRRLGATADRIEQDLKPIMANLQAVTSDAARTTALAAATVERADRAIQEATRQVQQALGSLPSLIESARDGFNVLGGLRTLIGAFREVRAARRRPAVAEDDDALFIG